MKQDGYSVFVVRGQYPSTPIDSDRKGLEALVAACKEGTVSGAVGGSTAAKATPTAAAFQVCSWV